MSPRNPVLVFDIETIPDPEHHHGDDFPKALFHQIVTISYLKAELVEGPDGQYFSATDAKSVGRVDSSEQELVSRFTGLIERIKPRLVTFNGRGFDLPVLKYRALKYGLSAPWLSQGQGKWENYGQRYSVDWHCDLMDALSEFGASKAAKLSEVCALLALPGKTGMDGSQVAAYVAAGRIEDVRAYCEEDVLTTYQVFLRYALLRGEINAKGLESSTTGWGDATSGQRALVNIT
jgi:predicted PolB exonuclease-like 3'-5' exonuclease